MRIGQSEPCLLPITYEMLPSLCYCCGKLGHTLMDCETMEHRDEGISDEELPFEDFMRVSPMKSTTVVVEKNAP